MSIIKHNLLRSKNYLVLILTLFIFLHNCKPYEKILARNVDVIMTNSRLRIKYNKKISPIFKPQNFIMLVKSIEKCEIRHFKTKNFYRASKFLKILKKSWPISCTKRHYGNFDFIELPSTFYYDSIKTTTLLKNLTHSSFSFSTFRYGKKRLHWELRPLKYRLPYIDKGSSFLVRAELKTKDKIYWLLKPYYGVTYNLGIEMKALDEKSLLNKLMIEREDYLVILWFWR